MSSERSVVLCTGGFDHSIRFWEAPTGLCHRTFQYNDSQINKLEITQDKSLLAVAGNPNIRLYEINSNNQNPIASFEGHTNNVTGVGFQRDKKWLYSCSEDSTVKIWDIRANNGSQRDYQSKAPVNTVCLHPNQGELITGDEEGNIRVFDLTANSCSYELIPDGKTAIRSLCVAQDASLILASTNRGTVFAWKLGRGSFEALHKIDAHNTYCLKALLSPDSKYLATTSSDKTVKIWNVEKNFALEKTLTGHSAWVWDCSFSADSAYLVTASSDRTAKLWDVKSGEIILEYKGHHKAITAVALNDSS
jgi:G protein beta subunit-like protein